MSSLKSIDMLTVKDVFDMHGGYVLTFSNKTFAEFFAEELFIDIDEPKYAIEGDSKGKRLTYFLRQADDALAAKTLEALWEWREATRARFAHEEKVQNAKGRLFTIVERLKGGSTVKPAAPMAQFDPATIARLQQELLRLTGLEPQPRGYAFEKFLKELFDANGLKAREAFRLRGEQIDGSFDLNNDIYLLEGKWQNSATGVDDLHTFHGKIEQKAAWTRGLFVSYTGFTEVGLNAWGRGKRVICMDGRDIYETLNRQLPLNLVLAQKVRQAAETGNPFIRVADLKLV